MRRLIGPENEFSGVKFLALKSVRYDMRWALNEVFVSLYRRPYSAPGTLKTKGTLKFKASL